MANTNFVVRTGLTVNNALTVNSTAVVIKIAGSGGSNGQVLSSNGSGGLSWADALTATGNTTFSGNVIFSGTVYANGSTGDAGQVLTSNGSGTYWSTVAGGANGTSIALTANNTDSSSYYFPLSNSSSGTWANGVIANTRLYFVPATGTLSATTFNSLSDSGYKTDISKINNSIDILKQIDGVSFKWKDTGYKSYGVIAQEVEKILPEIVDINNNVKSVNYQALIGFLIEAVKDLSEKVEKLENAQ